MNKSDTADNVILFPNHRIPATHNSQDQNSRTITYILLTKISNKYTNTDITNIIHFQEVAT